MKGLDMNNYPVIALLGMCGSGKSVLTQMFVEKKWSYVYFGGVTLDELSRQNLEHNAQNERKVREELRKKYGPEAYAELLLPKIIEYSKNKPTVLDGLYSWPEYKFIKSRLGENLILIAVVTNSDIRYSRLSKREIRPLSRNEAIDRDHAEIEKLEKGGPIAIADHFIINNGTLEELKSKFNKVYDSIGESYCINFSR